MNSILKAHQRRLAIHAANRGRIEREREDLAKRMNLPTVPGKPVTVAGDQLLERLKESKR